MDEAELPQMQSELLNEFILGKLKDLDLEKKKDLVNKILKLIDADDDTYVIEEKKMLSAIISGDNNCSLKATQNEIVRPLSGFRVSTLFTGGQSVLSLDSEIKRDIASADRISIIVSFLKLSGLRLILNDLKEFCNVPGHKLRIITTTYCGITESKAVQQLSELPNTEIRISYNTNIERLHAKSYIFERNSGFNTGYIGSSNLSKSAQTDGLEWNIRVTNVENPHIIKSALATFDIYWNSPNFEDFNHGGIAKFNEATQKEMRKDVIPLYQKYTLLPHQKLIIDKLQIERERGICKNLIVASTGTGKTVISAFDYSLFRRKNRDKSRILFIAHREEILKQALRTYRCVLQDYNWGDLWVGNNKPKGNLDHLFISVQTFNSQYEEIFSGLSSQFYDYIVIDEAHHIVANSYRNIINHFSPQLLIGLTATPERMDGSSLLPDFDGLISAEIRLPKALEAGLLTPFQYLCISDNTDLSSDDLMSGNKYISSKLSDKLSTKERAYLIIERLRHYLADERECRALCFCTDKKHSDFMAAEFNKYGLNSASLHSDNSFERDKLNKQLAEGKINYLFVVDMFNEGIDIPEIDTVLFLRPTESLTIFLQQLGRGLRLAPGKQMLTVLDFVAQLNNKYDYSGRFRALLTKSDRSVADQIKNGFTMLPLGCSIIMEEKAKEYVLQNIKSAIYNRKRLIRELQSYMETPSLSEFMKDINEDIRLIYRNGYCWSKLKKEAGKCSYGYDDTVMRIEKGIGGLVHINSVEYLKFIEKMTDNQFSYKPCNSTEESFSLMFYYTLFQDKISKVGFADIYHAIRKINDYPFFVQEIKELVEYLSANLEIKTFSVGEGMPDALEKYGVSTREALS